MKRLRKPKLTDGELRIYWGHEPGDIPDIMFAWQGDRSMKRDAGLLHYIMANKRPDPFAKPIFSKMDPSLFEELEARGYDLTTLKFSIMKKSAHGINAPMELKGKHERFSICLYLRCNLFLDLGFDQIRRRSFENSSFP